ncbi:7TM diverse intracellular signaling domain-containing protein [Paenibacillus barengoltzii]|uniref:ATP-binding protein n=1 Tax=Paenibacillus barengoltzii TaxID=343517 RepID=UPI002DB6AFFC|nr:ATP-binding protein [Paenibacillus barengoltzii]MEC2343083.1 7TM diverse intracellular signaling domain-containing protein [Paenibacillus barengoltzii]
MRGMLRFSSRKIILYIAAAIMVGLVTCYAVISASNSTEIQSDKGTLDLSQVQVSERPIKLQGEWEFYWHELLSPNDIHDRIASDGNPNRWINLPNSWLGYRLDGQQLSGTGFATFRVMIQLSEQDRHERLALKMPSIFHAYKLWVNGEPLAEVGVVGQDKSSMTPRLATKFVYFQPENNTVELVIQVSNFHHKRGGITKFIELGGSDVLTVRTHLKIAGEIFITASLMVIGLYHLLLFILRRKDRAPLFFGLFALLLGIRSLLVGELLLTQLWPNFPWEIQFKIEYLTLCSSGYIITRYYISIFANYVSRWFRLGSRIVTGLLCLIVVAAPAIIYTHLLSVIGVVVVLHMLYLMVGLVQSAVQRKEGALIFLLASMVTLVTVINDFLYFNEWSSIGNTSPLGLLIFTVAQMFLLSSRFTKTATNEERIARELQEANDKLTEMNMNLEQTVQERTHALSVAHDNLRISYDRLLLSEQGRKKLLSYITHDLRLPLSSMLGYVEAVQDGVKPERNEQYLRYIRDNTIRVNRMIEELSYLSHLETGQVMFQMEPIPVAQFLRQFYDQYELVVRDTGLEFVLDLGDSEDPGSESLVAEIDMQRLDQALFNIVSNAMKFTASGGAVRIALAVNEVKDRRYANICVEDTGTGIPPEHLEHIFERHYRYEQPGAEKRVEGSGLGLAICREIVQVHVGTVRAESDGKTGAAFYISIPCIRREEG